MIIMWACIKTQPQSYHPFKFHTVFAAQLSIIKSTQN